LPEIAILTVFTILLLVFATDEPVSRCSTPREFFLLLSCLLDIDALRCAQHILRTLQNIIAAGTEILLNRVI